ncbi:MAG: hypothetical protein Q8906_12050 [Bacillota bacterium]|nr:hypothetical protein [Bacillota bacterium]MDP4171335.1 hypothetical protein [Bacillota bacterium]
MKDEMMIEVMDHLKSGQLSEYFVKKEDFLPFRQLLVKREDFKNFRGIAQRGGDVLYRYTNEARS